MSRTVHDHDHDRETANRPEAGGAHAHASDGAHAPHPSHDDHPRGKGGDHEAHDDHPHGLDGDQHPHGDGGDHAPHGEHGHGHGEHGHGQPTGRWASIKHFLGSVYGSHSHDASDSVDNALETSERGIRALKISLVILGITAAFQLVITFASGSVALLADTIHNFSDALTAVPLWIAFSIGRRVATRRYTYGYGRAEDIAGVFIVLMIALSAAVAGWESIHRLINPQTMDHVLWVLAAGVIGFFGNEAVAFYRIRVGRQIGSAALVADGYHARADGFTSLAVVGGALGVLAGFPMADPLVGLAITVAILFVLRDAGKSILQRLMDAVDPQLTEKAVAVVSTTRGVEAEPEVRIRWIGHKLSADARIVVDSDRSLPEAHAIAEDVRHRLLHDVPKLSEVSVHVDPCDHSGTDHHAGTAHHFTRAGTARA